MARQHCVPLLLTPENDGGAVALTPLGQQTSGSPLSEADIQALVHAHPMCLPIAEIDTAFQDPVPICTELHCPPAGFIDNLLVTPTGLPVLVECKLWRNPEGRREVVGQILDYAKELSRWSSSDLQREVSRCLKRDGNPLFDLVRATSPHLDEMQFNDALTTNLRRGRFLLLIVGDGIREGVEAIAEYLQAHAGLHFSFGLVELPIYLMPDGGKLVVPRILARTTNITRNVVAMPDGFMVEEPDDTTPRDVDTERSALGEEQLGFWAEFLAGVRLDDPEQPMAKPARLGHIEFSLPVPSGSGWLTVYRNMRRGELGVFLSSHRNTAGDYAMKAIAEDWEVVKGELGGTAKLIEVDGRPRMVDALTVGSLDREDVRGRGFAWLAERVNTFVNVMRPRVRSAVLDYLEANKGAAS